MAVVNSVVRALLARRLRYHCLKTIQPTVILLDRRHLSNSRFKNRDLRHEKVEKKLIQRSGSIFDEAAKKARNKVTFRQAVGTYLLREGIYRRGHVEFIYAALKRMEEFGVEKDLETYKKILEILPPHIMIPRSNWQVEMQHYPRQQQCAIDMMEQMENNGVIPDNEFGDMILCRFGKDAHASRKYRRMMYWLPKFKNLNPYPIPDVLPEDPMELARIALARMAVDLENKITVHKTTDMEEEPLEDTFIAYAQSPKQQELIGCHPLDRPVYVEGGYTVWVKSHLQTYFVLITDPDPNKFKQQDEEEEEALFNWTTVFEEEKKWEITPAASIHEQEDGTVLAMCITGTATKHSLVTWIRYLQLTNPRLEQIPVVFRLRSPDSGLQLLDESNGNGLLTS